MGIACLISLGTWQLHRMKWKESILQELETFLHEPAQPLTTLISNNNKEPQNFRKVIVKGTFDPHIHLKWMSRTHEGKVGYHSIVPFNLSSGGTLLVDCGWVPQHMNASLPHDLLTLTLMIRYPEKPSAFTPDNAIHKGEIYSIQLKEIASTLEMMTLLPYYGVLLENTNLQPYPHAKAPLLHLHNNHFIYAITWYILALALAFIYIIHIKKSLTKSY